MSTTTTIQEALDKHVAFVINDLLSISDGTYDFDPDEHSSPLDAWMESQLSVEFIGKCTFSGPWEVTSVEIVSTTGGPHVEVEWNRSGNTLSVKGYWGSNKAFSYGLECPELEEHLEELCDFISHS